MIRDYLIPKLASAFPDKDFDFSSPHGALVSIKFPCNGHYVLEIFDEGDEASVYISDATHRHFDCCFEAIPTKEREERIVGDIISFLDALFKDRVVIWSLGGGGFIGGCRTLKPGESPPRRSFFRTQFTWSREI